MLPLDICCCTFTTARNIDLTGFTIKSSICWQVEMNNIEEKLDIEVKSHFNSLQGTVQSLLLHWNCVLMMFASVTDNRNFHYNGICYINECWYRFLCSTIYYRKYSSKKKIITHLTSPFLSTLETYFVFYLRCELFSPFQCLIPFCSSQSTQYRADTQEIADEEMRWMKCSSKANKGNLE